MKRRAAMLDKEWLRTEYIDKGKTRKQIAAETGLTAGRVGNLLQEYGVKRYSVERHGLSAHPLSIIWSGIKERCCNPNADNYKWYGAEGITMCDEWRDFSAFFQWAKDNGWQNGLTIDRIDGSKGYSPDNCRFITIKQQCRNRRTNVYITVNDITMLQCEWEEYFGLRPKIIAKWKHQHGIDYVINRLRMELELCKSKQ